MEASNGTVQADPGLAREFCGIELRHPVINGSGTFDAIAARRAFGDQLLDEFPFSAFVSKTITPEARDGNPPPPGSFHPRIFPSPKKPSTSPPARCRSWKAAGWKSNFRRRAR